MADDLRERMALYFNKRLMDQQIGASCATCGVANPLVLVQYRRPVICYTCRSKKTGKSGIERHHLGGRPSPLPPIAIDANLHRTLTFLQIAWRHEGHAPGTEAAVEWDRKMLAELAPRWTDSERPVSRR